MGDVKNLHIGQITSFYIPPVTLVGSGSCKQIPDRLACRDAKYPLIVTDKGIVACGILKTITDILDAANVKYAVYDGAVPNPTDTNVEEAFAMYKEKGCDSLMTLGGGSAHDCGKGVGFLVANGGRIHDYEGVNKSSKPFPPYVAVNTTAGTASEMTRFCIITDTSRKVKMAIVDWRCTPGVAIDDPDLMMGMPPALTAATGMDALTHAIEGYTTLAAWELADTLNIKAVELIAKSLRKAVENDPDGREGMALGQYMTGMAFSNVGLGVVHGMAHPLSAFYNTPHGVANAVLLPYVMEYNAEYTGEKYREIARAMGVKGVDSMTQEEYRKAAIDAVKQLSIDVNIPQTLAEIGVKEEDLEALTDAAMADVCTGGNPRPCTWEEVLGVYKTAFGK